MSRAEPVAPLRRCIALNRGGAARTDEPASFRPQPGPAQPQPAARMREANPLAAGGSPPDGEPTPACSVSGAPAARPRTRTSQPNALPAYAIARTRQHVERCLPPTTSRREHDAPPSRPGPLGAVHAAPPSRLTHPSGRPHHTLRGLPAQLCRTSLPSAARDSGAAFPCQCFSTAICYACFSTRVDAGIGSP